MPVEVVSYMLSVCDPAVRAVFERDQDSMYHEY